MPNKKQFQKHIPMRMCIVTREKKPKAELLRLVRLETGEIVVDPKGKLKGRGANITMDADVFELALKKHIIEKALNLNRKLTAEEIEKLRAEFDEALEEKVFRKGNRNVTLRVTKAGSKEVIR